MNDNKNQDNFAFTATAHNDLRKKAKFGNRKLRTSKSTEPNFAFLSERDSWSGKLGRLWGFNSPYPKQKLIKYSSI